LTGTAPAAVVTSPLDVKSVADYKPTTLLIYLVNVGLDVSSDLGLQRRGQHLPGTIPDDLIQQRRARRRRAGRVGLAAVTDYLEHRRTSPNRRTNAGP
jgi:hypothetical protein